ncbi:putative ABC transport system ATP-binding protein [Marinospirillum celere]|uniref:Putative ABC transport system ATP-binding protein n=1 Tax=Marinospirillum celere TaxID=1122252 RepID=A0A1I1H6N1_9GAMM|nr:ATP-binding cassette domain-containing protein [Marinospirillum celere]SFC19375.1 putative ABC transport system ATP-binding protein [Marinospirillum celere]
MTSDSSHSTAIKDRLSQKLLEAKSLGYKVAQQTGDLTILRDLNFQIQRGETLALLGPSGAGKSTLLALLAGLDTPTEGELLWSGQNFSSLGEDERAAVRAREVGFIFQSFQLLPELTALENVLLPLELRGDKDAEEQALLWLEKVGLSPRASHHPSQLSGGEQQRVAIARAFATRPAVLFADEPTGNLDAENGHKIADLLFSLNQDQGSSDQQMTLILVTHDQQLASRCQRILRLDAGQLFADEQTGAAQ